VSEVETRPQLSPPEAAPAPVGPSDRSLRAPACSAGPALAELAAEAVGCGLRRVEVLAWRDLDDPEAGGSELHVHEVARRWAGAGLEVTVRTSAVGGAPRRVERHGYHAVRSWGRYAVFPASAVRGATAGRRVADGLVEVWNGMPFFSPLWRRRTRVVFLHHVHAEMWRMVLPGALARLGESVELRWAPALYRHTPVVTLSESSRREIETVLGLRRVEVVPPGVGARFTPGPGRSPVPTVLAVGRLVPVKQLPLLVEVLAEVRRRVPDVRAVIVGEGYGRGELEAAVRRVGGEQWIDLVGRCSEEDLVSHYRRAWVLASASRREGWGMTVTEAGACGTPAVVSAIAGHRDAVVHGVSGLLADGPRELADAITRVLLDRVLRQRLGRGALARAASLDWEATAAGTLRVLLAEHRRSRPARLGRPVPPSRPRRAPAPAR
jgi:glycosyltransferase involved in cell wall biosynthesis